jgi:hypothetical protein
MYSPAQNLLATPHTQARIIQIKDARRSSVPGAFPFMRVTVSVANFVKLMYCNGTQADGEKPVTLTVPNPILQAALSKTPQSDGPSGLNIHSVSAILLVLIRVITTRLTASTNRLTSLISPKTKVQTLKMINI